MNNKCYYCGIEITKEESHNAEDFGVHPETQGKLCCKDCNQMIVVPNRFISEYYLNKGDKGLAAEFLISYFKGVKEKGKGNY